MSILGFADSNQILIRIQSSQVTKTLRDFHERNNITVMVGVAKQLLTWERNIYFLNMLQVEFKNTVKAIFELPFFTKLLPLL